MALLPYTEAIDGNTRRRYFGTAAPTIAEVSYTFAVGDEVINSVPAAGGATFYGWVCTTAGVGGTAVFKGFGLIQA
jgi:hypothetical protein